MLIFRQHGDGQCQIKEILQKLFHPCCEETWMPFWKTTIIEPSSSGLLYLLFSILSIANVIQKFIHDYVYLLFNFLQENYIKKPLYDWFPIYKIIGIILIISRKHNECAGMAAVELEEFLVSFLFIFIYMLNISYH